MDIFRATGAAGLVGDIAGAMGHTSTGSPMVQTVPQAASMVPAVPAPPVVLQASATVWKVQPTA